MSTLLDTLKQAFPHLEFKAEESLAQHTYFKIGGPAEVFLIVKTSNDLADLAEFAGKNQIKFTVLGGASNVLINDQGLRGLVVKNNTSQVLIKPGDKPETFILEADSGAITNLVVRKALDNSLDGLQLFLGVPGTIGGAVFNNSHFLKVLIGENILEVECVTRQGEHKTYSKSDMKFAYDYSILHETHDTIIKVRFLLKKGDKTTLEERAKYATTYRATTQPLGIPSSGCMFQNAIMPDGSRESAGKLVDMAGLKGLRVGDAVVSDKHANFILNVGKATSEEVDQLVAKVTAAVKDKFGAELKREVFSLS